MADNKHILFGRITKIHGYEGAVTVKVEKIFSDNIPEMESIFLEVDGKAVPFFIYRNENSGQDNIKLKFEGYDTIEKIREFIGCRVFISTGQQNEIVTNEIQDLKGFMVFSQTSQFIGNISEVIKSPGQWLLNIISDSGKELLIPYHEELIIELKPDQKKLIMEIAKGLTDIN
jgi:16S rRNA processing protein RimM